MDTLAVPPMRDRPAPATRSTTDCRCSGDRWLRGRAEPGIGAGKGADILR